MKNKGCFAMETRKLYYEDSHLREFSAEVLSCEPGKQDFEIVLSATAFYPEGGGQSGDTGLLGGVRVLDTREKEGSLIHFCDGPLAVGQIVEGILDWDRRFDRMQQHSGEHIVSGLIHAKFGWHNVGFHMGADVMTIDFDGVVPPEALVEIEARANEAVWKNLPLHIWTPSPQELPGVFYRTKKALPWPVRIVEIPGYDSCACCGTHVTNTGEIGLVKIFSSLPCRGGTRIEMACGRMALDILSRAYEQNRQVSQAFSAKILETGEAAEKMNEALDAWKYRASCLEKQIFDAKAASFAGKGDVLAFEENLDSTGVRELADRIAEVCGGRAAVFSGKDGEGYSFCLVTRDGDLRSFGKDMTRALNGRGGGKPSFQQGKVSADRTAIEAFFAEN